MVAERARRTPAVLLKASELLLERAEQIAADPDRGDWRHVRLGMFNCELAAGMLREAAAQAYGPLGDVIPSDVPGKLAMARPRARRRRRRDRSLERARDPL